MQSPLTLHDFVMNLLCDADAQAAFDLDPDGTLRAAGLGDVTPADVRDVLPLVADYLPAHVTGQSQAHAVDSLHLPYGEAAIHESWIMTTLNSVRCN